MIYTAKELTRFLKGIATLIHISRISNATNCIRFCSIKVIFQQSFNLLKQFNCLIEDKSEIGTEAMKFDGFCVRTFDEDLKWEEFEKSNKNNPKKVPAKKK